MVHHTTDRGSNQAGMFVTKFSAVFLSGWLCLLTGILLAPRSVLPSSSRDAVPATSAPRPGLYADDPAHLWNRLHRTLYVRVSADGQEHGLDDVDPLLWRETNYLLTEPSHSSALRLLDEFLQRGGERLIVDPLKRAVFQHDLWALFDWLAARLDHHPEARKALLSRLARVIRRVALIQKQIESLPDNYAAAVSSGMFVPRFDASQPDRAFLPPDLTAGNGQWLAVSANEPVAAQHASEISHSSFSVKWQVPGGATATLAYWKALWDHPQPYVIEFDNDGERRVMVNPALPAIPRGTQLALVRRMLLIDQRGMIVPSRVTESVQLRLLQEPDQRFFEFRVRRARLFAGQAGGLQAIGPGDSAFFTFSSHGIDAFEAPGHSRARPPEILKGCQNCHQQSRPMIHSVLSLRRLLKPQSQLDSRHPRWHQWFTQDAVAAGRKAQRADWGLLQGLWLSNPW